VTPAEYVLLGAIGGSLVTLAFTFLLALCATAKR
jgi:hypothetical protein